MLKKSNIDLQYQFIYLSKKGLHPKLIRKNLKSVLSRRSIPSIKVHINYDILILYNILII
jgi:hypothetical protein